MEPSVICKKINTTHGKTDDMESSYVSRFKCLNIVKSFEIPTNIFFGTQLSSFRCSEDFSDLLNFFFSGLYDKASGSLVCLQSRVLFVYFGITHIWSLNVFDALKCLKPGVGEMDWQ